MRITVRQLKRLIKEAVSGANNQLKKQLFRELTAELNSGVDEDKLFHISNVTELSKYVSEDLMAVLTSECTDDEIMMMYGEWEWTRNK